MYTVIAKCWDLRIIHEMPKSYRCVLYTWFPYASFSLLHFCSCQKLTPWELYLCCQRSRCRHHFRRRHRHPQCHISLTKKRIQPSLTFNRNERAQQGQVDVCGSGTYWMLFSSNAWESSPTPSSPTGSAQNQWQCTEQDQKPCWPTRMSPLPLLSVGRWHRLVTSRGITASERPSCKATAEGGRTRGRWLKSWSDNTKESTDMTIPELLRATANKSSSRKLSVSTALKSPDPRRLGVNGLMIMMMMMMMNTICTN